MYNYTLSFIQTSENLYISLTMQQNLQSLLANFLNASTDYIELCLKKTFPDPRSTRGTENI